MTIIRNDQDMTAMHLLANRLEKTTPKMSNARHYWEGVRDALTWLCETEAAPVLDVRWKAYQEWTDSNTTLRGKYDSDHS